jgi:hypothetical protein
MAKRDTEDAEATAAATCPSCGKDVDPDLDFCHWCTERIAAEPDADSDDSGASA